MKSSTFKNIKASIPSKKKAKFDLSHDVNTTYDWGSVQPLFNQLMLPDSSININMEQLTRLAPMVVPTFGRVKMKNISHFVPIKEIFPNWEYFLAKQQVSRPGTQGTVNTFVPNVIPHINNSILTMFALAGAKFNWYVSGATEDPGINNVNTWRSYKNVGSFGTIDGDRDAIEAGRIMLYHLFHMTNAQQYQSYNLHSINYEGPIADFRFLTTGIMNNGTALSSGIRFNSETFSNLPAISTIAPWPFNDVNTETHSANAEQSPIDSLKPIETITMEGADLIWESDVITTALRTDANSIWNGMNTDFFDGCKIRICFKLSSFGKRLRKVLIGLGYNFSLTDGTEVSILPLLAYFKAYWDSYAPERDRNFYMTDAWKIIQFCEDSNANCAITSVLNNNTTKTQEIISIIKRFIFDVGTTFATEKVNAISAATDEMFMQAENSAGIYDIVAEIMSEYNKRFIDAEEMVLRTNPEISELDNTNYEPALRNALNNSYARLSQPQLDVLKKAYIYVNKYSVAGKQIEEILRMNGLGNYVEECRGKFITADESTVKISDVVATAQTNAEDAADRVELGQYGGRGLGIGNGQISFNTDKHGYFIVLSSIVPESGYVNAPDMTNEAIEFGDFYQPEFDGINYEAVAKKQVIGSPLVNSKGDNTMNSTFGLLPTYSNWKFRSNKANGDFSLNSQAKSLTPYTLDKYIPVDTVNVRTVLEDADPDNHETYTYVSPTFTYRDLPNAGEEYRYINKMAWNGNYNRIFKNINDGVDWVNFSLNNNAYLYNSYEYDNFLVHNVFNVAYWAPMKSIEDSYNTYDEDDNENRSSIKRS